MPRFFIGGSNIIKSVIFIAKEDVKHMNVLRMKIGDHIVMCDGSGMDYKCRISRITEDSAEAEILEAYRSETDPSFPCVIIAGLPKGDKTDIIVQKCTELGADSIIFFHSERTVVKLDKRKAPGKVERWNKIAEEASKQSGRGKIPGVSLVLDFAGALDAAKKTSLQLFFSEGGEREPIKEVLRRQNKIESAAIITGPEGGFAPYEVELARRVGLTICSMGPRILRCETAPMAALTMLMYESGNM